MRLRIEFFRLCVVSCLAGYAALAGAAIPACVSGRLPQFEDYAVAVAPVAKRPPLRKDTAFARRFQSGLAVALSRNKVNLAQAEIVASFGCGTNCLMYGTVDTRTGKAVKMDVFFVTGSEQGEVIETRAGSQLVRFNSVLITDQTVLPGKVIFYTWNGQRLQPVCQITPGLHASGG
jgi:hypothetical protein